MATSGIQGYVIETHNWGKSVAFWQGLGYEVQFETDHHSGQLAHPAGGPFLFIAEVAPEAPLDRYPIIGVADAAHFVPPSAGEVRQPFRPQHWGVDEMTLADPDGRVVSVQASQQQ